MVGPHHHNNEPPVLDVIAKDGYDLFAYENAKRSLSDLAGLESDGAKTNEC